MLRRAAAAVLAASALAAWRAPLSRAGDLASRTIPGKWFEALAPESDPEPFYPEYVKKDPVARAKLQLDAGQYRRALATLAKADVSKSSPANVANVAVLKAKAYAAVGRREAAIELLSRPEVADDLSAQVLRADVLGQLQRYSEAVALLEQIAAKHPESIAAHYYLGWYEERSGDYASAGKSYQWFQDPPRRYLDQWQGHPQDFTSAEDVVLLGRALDRWATFSSAYQQNEGLNNVLLSMFVRAYTRIDTGYEPAHVAAAEYFLSHDDSGEAMKELGQALRMNPHDIAAHALLGKIALDQYNFAAADGETAAIRRTDPDSLDADVLEARNLLLQRRPKDALPPLEAVLAQRPKDVAALGLLAGAQALLLHDDKTAEALKQADAIQPASYVAYMEVAEQLSGMRQYPRAAAMYKIAIARAPWFTAARNGLGLLMTQSGDEAAARVVLEAAHAVDPFNVRATNYLKLLDMMDKFARKESPHFTVMYDSQQDPMIPEYFSDYLESIYSVVCGDFKFEPMQKTLIEVFPSHDAFSVRTTGAPWIATVGASTGRVIALAAPRAGAGGTFNWAQVVRHEFTHTVTLGATDNRIAHWFTEGLAVWEEHSPLQWEWVPMLQDAVNHHKLFPLENLTWAFVRPRQPSDRQLAYAESYWICTYVEEKFGHQAILDLVEQFRLGRDQDEAFQTVLKEGTTQFFTEFQAWCKKQVDGWGYDAATSGKYEKLVAEADALIQGEHYDKAATKWEQVVALRPMDLLPHVRLMGLYIQLKDFDKAADQLEILNKVELKDNKYAKVLARLYAKQGKLDLACDRALKAVFINPYDPAAHELLEGLYEKAGNQAGADREKRVIPVLRQWLDDAKKAEELPPAPPPPAN